MKAPRRSKQAEPIERRAGATIVRFVPAGAARAGRNGRAHDPSRCHKCDSTYIVREPAFVHCRYCGAMNRIQSGSLLDQEEFEMRSGLRLAS
ncbi:MAG: hypothetical protein AUG14_07035 [Candidatus Rokubacteria bacterium 13_1_20CM_2_68_19]|nr:MAG: hypothetical protein AUI04_10155 [Candidatus Rokubacteria bacterium 13_2_20CM_2_64_8]OLC63312.1 MAG: hypothetical protein AUH76_06675 [Candidatus Rokubacteria bacterium 13_1_40CM_4_67_11]OLD97887.1 MAG: hypothetical protein AUG80_09630 [Candidatus Rokubacteria bacterium 13_1_20CM_4_68_9]OLE43867.1 MAG: hypothetical protein AUG14_07035 [Candidatus Rokubacteria bacterium 13_1_20CM_2_68_19]